MSNGMKMKNVVGTLITIVKVEVEIKRRDKMMSQVFCWKADACSFSLFFFFLFLSLSFILRKFEKRKTEEKKISSTSRQTNIQSRTEITESGSKFLDQHSVFFFYLCYSLSLSLLIFFFFCVSNTWICEQVRLSQLIWLMFENGVTLWCSLQE